MATKICKMEFCDVCGTMLLLGVCRRCNPGKTVSDAPIKPIMKGFKKTGRPTAMETHRAGVNIVEQHLISTGTFFYDTANHYIDFMADVNGELSAIKVVAQSQNPTRVPLSEVYDHVADYFFIVTSLKHAVKKLFVISTDDIRDRKQTLADGSEWIDYKQYKHYQVRLHNVC